MALDFNGSNQYIEDGSPPVTSAPFTVSFWFYSNSSASSQIPFFIGGSADPKNPGIKLNTAGAGSVAAASTNSGGTNATCANTYTVNVWQHVAATFEAGVNMTCVLNGDWANRGTVTGDPALPTINRIAWGAARDSSPGQFYNGALAWGALWNVVLTQAEIESLAAGADPRQVRPAALQELKPMQDQVYRGWVSGNVYTAGSGPIALQDDGVIALRGRSRVQVTSPPSSVTADITGTIGDGATESEIQDTGGTVVITLTNDTWVAAGATFDAQRQAIIDGLDSAQSEGTGWNATVRDALAVGAVARTSDTVVTITVPATAGYGITSNETVTVTIPAASLVTSSGDVTGANTFAITAYAPGTVTLTDLTDLRVYQRDASDQYDGLTVSGTYTNDSDGNPPSAIYYRIVEHGTDTAVPGHDWTVLDASPSGGVFSEVVNNIPSGGWYNLDTRWETDDSTIDGGSSRWGVGHLLLCIGQSNMRNLFQVGTSYAQTGVGSQYTGTTTLGESTDVWAATAASGARELVDAINSVTGLPVGLIKHAVGSTALVADADTGAGNWSTYGSGIYAAMKTDVDALGGVIEVVIMDVGATDALRENNGGAPMTISEHKAALVALAAQLNSDFSPGAGQSVIPFIISQTGRDTRGLTGADVGYTAIREAQRQAARDNANIHLGAVNVGATLTDGIHRNEAGYRSTGVQLGNAWLNVLGETAVAPHPTIARFEIVDATHTDIVITHGDGTDFTPTSSITGFRVNDGALAVSAAARQSATSIRLTHASGTVTTVDYMYGATPTVTGLVVDNTAIALPLVPQEDIPANEPAQFDGPNISNLEVYLDLAMGGVDVSARFSDPESDALTYDKAGTWPDGVTVTSGGVIQGTPTETGEFTGLTVTATDGGATASSNTFSITVVEAPPPVDGGMVPALMVTRVLH